MVTEQVLYGVFLHDIDTKRIKFYVYRQASLQLFGKDIGCGNSWSSSDIVYEKSIEHIVGDVRLKIHDPSAVPKHIKKCRVVGDDKNGHMCTFEYKGKKYSLLCQGKNYILDVVEEKQCSIT